MLTIHSLTLDHVAGVDHARLELPDTGVVVVHGPNEMGKSTLLTAFRLLLSDIGVATKKSWVRALKSATTDEPTTVSAELTVDGHRLTVLKSFNKGAGRCELTVTAPRAERLTGRQASDRFAEILAEGVDTDLIDALTIEQGESMDILAASGIRSLEQALGADESEGRQQNPGDGAEALIGRINAEYARYFTPGGRPSRELADAVATRDAATADHEVAQTRYAQAQGIIAELERLTAERAAVTAQEPGAVTRARDATVELEAGRVAAAELDRHRDRAVTAREALDHARQQAGARAELIRELAAAREEVTVCRQEVQDATAAAEQEKERSGTLRNRITEVREHATVAKAWSGYVTAGQRHRDAVARAATLARRADRAELIRDEAVSLADRLERSPVTGTAVEALRRAEAALRQAVTVRETVATTVEVTGPADGEVTVDAEPLDLADDPVTLLVTGRREIGVGDYTLTVTPARDLRDIDDEVVRTTAERDRILDEFGVSDLPEAEARADRRREDEDVHRETVLRLAQVTGDSTVEGLREQSDQADHEVQETMAAVNAALDRVRTAEADAPEGLPEIPGIPVAAAGLTVEEIDAAVTAGAAELADCADDADRTADALRDELDRATRGGAVVRLERRRVALDSAEERCDRVSASLTAARDKTDDAELDNLVRDRRTASETAEATLAEALRATGDVDLEVLEGLASGAEARVRHLRERMTELGHAASRATGALGEHSGVAEALESTRADAQRAAQGHRQVLRRAQAAAALHAEVQVALAAARQRYEAPFRATMERLARILYGAPVTLEFDTDLGVARRVLGGVPLETTQLSGGAREQLSVLTRLAVADLVGGGESVPVIIDDALGFSDRGRIGRMNVVLDSLGQDHQIIVLTCDIDRFTGIAGAVLVPMEQVLDHSGTPG